MHTITEKNNYRQSFDSWGEFTSYIETAPLSIVGGSSETKSSDKPDKYTLTGWSGCSDWNSALGLAKTAEWPQGTKHAKAVMNPLVERISTLIETPSIVYDVEGAHIDMGYYLTGEPECWQRAEMELVAGIGTSVHRLVYSAGVSSGISTEAILRKGALIAALVNLMELGGHRIELVVNIHTEADNGHCELYVTVKQAHQPMDFDRIVYTLAHPSVLRRLFFRWVECLPEPHATRYFDHLSYGHPRTALDKGDITIDAMHLADAIRYDDPEAQRTWLLDMLKAQGIQIHGGTQ